MNYDKIKGMNKYKLSYLLAIFLFSSCIEEKTDVEDSLFLGTPIKVDVSLGDGYTQTRAITQMEIGSSAYLSTDHVVMREYYYSEEGKLTSHSPLVWTSADPITIYGYYVDGGLQIPSSDRSYSVTPTTHSYLAGKTIVKYNDTSGTYPQDADLTLRQQLAKILIRVKVADGTSSVTDGKLGGGMLYTSGVFSDLYNSNGYGIGGNGYVEGSSEGTGWTVLTNEDPVILDLDEPVYDSNTKTYTYTAIIMPQIVSNTTTEFFTIKVAGAFSAHYYLREAITFRAGRVYELVVDDVTKTLYLNNTVLVEDFVGYDASRIAITPSSTATWN